MTDRQPIHAFARTVAPDPVTIPLAFGDVLRRLRRSTGLSQEALAERATISWRTISDLERGIKRKPQQETFRLLVEALDLSPQDRAMLQSAMRGPEKSAALAAFVAPVPVVVAAPHELPVPMTPLIGRTQEIDAARALVQDGRARLLTITGPGGVGKTRLAIAVAGALAPEFPDGIAFVPLAPIRDPALLLSAITQSLGIKEGAGQSSRERLDEYLRDKRFLLVLDNFEQLTPEAATISALLAACPHLVLLITSRAALRLYGEHEYSLAPLPLPAPGMRTNLDALAHSAAVELFWQRAAAIRPGFVLTPENAVAIGEICLRLDGLPLAIELAVARIKLFSPAELLARLRDAEHGSSLALLTDGAHDAPTRQRTMRDAIAWSDTLLAEREQTLFRRLAVFVGGWSLEAAEKVCGGKAASIYDGITALIDQSLLQTREESGGETRFGMLETIHEFATESLIIQSERASLQRRHAQYFLGVAEAAEPGLYGPDQAYLLSRIDAEHENLRAALTWARREGDGEMGLRIAAALAQFWHVRGFLAEGRRWLETFLETARGNPSGADAATRARALEGLAIIATRQGETTLVDRASLESLQLYRDTGDQRGVARALHNLGRAALVRTDYEPAKAYYAESLALRRKINDRPGIAETLTNLGRLTRFQGDYAEAAALLAEAITIWRAEQDAFGLAMALGNLGHMARDRGDYAAATPLIDESDLLYRAVKNTRGISIVLGQRALLAYDDGRYAEAHTLAEQSLALSQEIGDTWGIANSHCTLGDIARANGNLASALDHYRESIAQYKAVGTMMGVAECLERIAIVSAAQAIEPPTARLLAAAAALREATNIPVLPVDRAAYDTVVATAQEALGPEAYARAWDAGHALSVDAAIAEALAIPAPTA